jgi:ASC-1-like (ASCH) protein
MNHEFEVKFTVFDKKLKVKVKAADEVEALERVKEAITVIGIQKIKPDIKSKEEDLNNFNNIMNKFFDQINPNK